MTTNIEEEYTSHEALKEWEKEKDQNNLTQNIVALLGIHGMHCQFYQYQNASHITKAFEDLFHQQLQRAREELAREVRLLVAKHYKTDEFDAVGFLKDLQVKLDHVLTRPTT